MSSGRDYGDENPWLDGDIRDLWDESVTKGEALKMGDANDRDRTRREQDRGFEEKGSLVGLCSECGQDKAKHLIVPAVHTLEDTLKNPPPALVAYICPRSTFTPYR